MPDADKLMLKRLEKPLVDPCGLGHRSMFAPSAHPFESVVGHWIFLSRQHLLVLCYATEPLKQSKLFKWAHNRLEQVSGRCNTDQLWQWWFPSGHGYFFFNVGCCLLIDRISVKYTGMHIPLLNHCLGQAVHVLSICLTFILGMGLHEEQWSQQQSYLSGNTTFISWFQEMVWILCHRVVIPPLSVRDFLQ